MSELFSAFFGDLNHLIALGSLAIGAFKSIKFVHEGELGIKLRFGKALRDKNDKPKVYQPGFIFIIPFAEVLQKHHVREQTADLLNQYIFIKDDLVFVLSGVVRYKVQDIYKALFNIDDLDDSIVDFTKGAMNDVIKIKSHENLRNTKEISEEVLKELKEIEKKWGIEIIDVKITSLSPDSNSARILSTSKEMKVKAKSLKDLESQFKGNPGVIVALAGATPIVNSSNPYSEDKKWKKTLDKIKEEGI